MKTSVIEVHDLLSVLTVDEVEKRIGEVPGVKSATVNYVAGNATVRYDETLLEVADIKVMAHQRGQQSAGVSHAKDVSEDKPAHVHAAAPAPDAAPASAPATTPGPAVPKDAPGAAAAMPAQAAPAGKGAEGKPVPDASPAAAAHKD